LLIRASRAGLFKFSHQFGCTGFGARADKAQTGPLRLRSYRPRWLFVSSQSGMPNMNAKHVHLVSRFLALPAAGVFFAFFPNALRAQSAAGGEPASMLVVSSDDGGVSPQQPPAAAGTELTVRGANAETADGALAAKANSQPSKPLSAIIIDPAVTPAAHTGGGRGFFSGGGPLRPSPASGIQPQYGRFPSGRPRHMSPPAVAKSEHDLPPQKRSGNMPGSSKQLLVQAYELSLKASTEAEYSQVVRWCAEGMKQGLDAESRQFALQLSAWALNRRGQLRADHNQRELAIVDFRAALDFDPTCWRALHNRSVSLAQGGQFAEAFDDVCKVIALNPSFAKGYANRGTLYVQAGDNDKAMADYDSALKLDPNLTAALVGRGRLCHMTGRLDEALENLTAAVESDPQDADIVCSRADLLVDLGRYSEALQDYARAIDLNPMFEHAYRNGAWLLATCPDDSIRDAEGALKGAQAAIDCGYGERHAALDTLAAALANAGRFEEAVGTMQQAIEVAPEDARAAYQARQQLYESHQPFRSRPIKTEVQTAEFVEANG
jgi:tetratricopeptide (TPR) repeat protein